jgi:glyoxylase-like metal-dependent hydrolase (beta-lactamase superfamily II)
VSADIRAAACCVHTDAAADSRTSSTTDQVGRQFARASSRVFDYLPDDTWFYPGHGDDSTLGEQKPHIDEWRERGW